MRFIIICLSCGYEREVFSRLRECPNCSSRDIEVLTSKKAREGGISFETDERPDLSRKMFILMFIGIIMLFAGMWLFWLAGIFSIFAVIIAVIGIIFAIVGAVGHWWYQ